MNVRCLSLVLAFSLCGCAGGAQKAQDAQPAAAKTSGECHCTPGKCHCAHCSHKKGAVCKCKN